MSQGTASPAGGRGGALALEAYCPRVTGTDRVRPQA
ncbi:hypothetical protein R2601_03978 [Salipiger bermudensis HTCC2601]|uniref:Uncharacterized protein n=1 Tax=Salipiger bermudensis (strain DSM 26914 / JCM 13377 / KCTC 12554 / HTCC2601) TaxID=314265 RepID=Q0FW50_SALBH|nr:hypothetical protein R2601_03978 [Salipiger bermudensis HTCC2601]